MARYTGPKWKVSRALSYPVFGDESYKRRPNKPGQHAQKPRRSGSAYSQQFMEKQKVKKTYGLLEKQFAKTFAIASKEKGNTAFKLLSLLELRLDNFVYRARLAKSRAQARQLVSHGNILVNGKKLDIPSYQVRVGDEISVTSKVANSDWFKQVKEDLKSDVQIANWIEPLDNGAKVKKVPEKENFDKTFNPQLIVEFYNR